MKSLLLLLLAAAQSGFQLPTPTTAGMPPTVNARAAPSPPELKLPRARHALILVGHPGDECDAQSFSETVLKLREGLTGKLGIPTDRQHILFGTGAPKGIPGATGPATREAVAKAIAGVRKLLKPEDGIWVICLGHCHHDGRQAWWNLPGPDLTCAEFGRLFTELNCREQVFVLTSSLSGYFVAPLARRGRVVIAATEADAETNETTFPAVFAQFLTTELSPTDHDVDSDGKVSLFDLYVLVAKEIAQNYAGAEQLATEHQQLDDDGDGIGHEVQTLYLPEAQGGPAPGTAGSRRPQRDGQLANRILLAPIKQEESP